MVTTRCIPARASICLPSTTASILDITPPVRPLFAKLVTPIGNQTVAEHAPRRATPSRKRLEVTFFALGEPAAVRAGPHFIERSFFRSLHYELSSLLHV